MRDISCKNQFVAHKIFSPRFSMAKRNVRYIKYGKIKRLTPRANTACNYLCWTARFVGFRTLHVFTDKLLGGAEDIVQIYVFNAFEYLEDIFTKTLTYFLLQ
jgi:hypothetical protein